MNGLLRTALVLLFLGSCSVFRSSAPSDLDNACSILRERPHYYRAMKASERKWGILVHVQMAIIYQESRFKSGAKTPRKYVLGFIPAGRQSSAYGYAQAIDATWDEYLAEEGGFLSRRDNMYHAADFIGWYTHKSYKKLGISKSDSKRQYLAYHEGRAGYARGSYRKKPWLLNVASKVGERSRVYARQLASCGYR